MNVLPLSTHFNAAVLTMASRVCPCGFDVLNDAPGSFDELQDYYAKTGRLAVWSGASDATIFGNCEVNYAFRAWHDWTHLTYNLPFTLDGERETARRQREDLRKVFGNGAVTEWFSALIECEVTGQAEAFAKTGQFPADQVAFTLAWLWRRNLPASYSAAIARSRVAA